MILVKRNETRRIRRSKPGTRFPTPDCPDRTSRFFEDSPTNFPRPLTADNHLVKNLMAAIFKMRFTTILFIYLSLLIILNQFSFLLFRPLKFETGTRMKFYAPPRPQKIFMRKKCDEYELTFKGNLVSDNDDGDDDDDGDGKDP